MTDFFHLSTPERLDALNAAANTSGLLPHLLEKDVWVVWSLRHLFAGPYAEHLVFKGGTSLSKAYGVIRRFSEDVDLTYDIRAIAGDLVGDEEVPLPASRSQEKKWTKEIRARLSGWVGAEIVPRLKLDLEQHGLPATVRAEGDKAFIDYAPLAVGRGYVAPAVMLEFGARSTGEPAEPRAIHCDAATHLQGVEFPTATPKVMRAERTFWEKATAIHVFCAQGEFRGGDRFARHWHDVTRLDAAGIADAAISDKALALRAHYVRLNSLPRICRPRTPHPQNKKGPADRPFFILAERVGFEPTVPVRGRRFSRPVHSTALPPLLLLQSTSYMNYLKLIL
jgi:hypothetical protein